LRIPSLMRSRSSESKAEEGGWLPDSKARGKIGFWKRKSANITEYDPTYRVIYLGNVLTGWAKGDGCVDKPLSTLWRNHIGSDKADIMMKVTVVGSGLRAVTKEHGLTEYWANRITYSVAHPAYPRVFCWIYRHEGRKMKQELRCHAVLCPREDKAREMATNLQNRLHQALVDFKKEKISRQNARLSLANSIHDNPSVPYRKLLLQSGPNNYKPPIERSKSAPKLTSIEEAELEEEEEDEDYEDEEDEHQVELRHVAEVHVEPSRVPPLPDNRLPPLPASRVPPLPTDSIYLGEESEDEDEITDYLVAEEEADSAQSASPASQGRSGSVSSAQECSPSREPDCHSLSSDAGTTGDLEDSLGKMKVSEQDTISDESGYSEEPISGGREVTVVTVNSDPCDTSDLTSSATVNNEHRLNIQLNSEDQAFTITTQSIPVRRSSADSVNSISTTRDSLTDSPRSPSPPLINTPSPRATDLSVKGVLLSEFSATEKLRYIERSNVKPTKPSLVLNRQEFCINI